LNQTTPTRTERVLIFRRSGETFVVTFSLASKSPFDLPLIWNPFRASSKKRRERANGQGLPCSWRTRHFETDSIMHTFLKKNWFFVGIAVVVVLALHFPALGLFVKQHKILNIGIFLTFLITGLSLDTRTVLEQFRNIRVLAAALFSALLLIPVVTAVLAGLVFPKNPDFVVGAVIIAAAPVTVASGTVMTAMALGNVPLSLFICVLCNFASLLSIPLVLKLLLGADQGIALPVGQIVGTLALTLLIPTLLGQALRPWLKEAVARYKFFFPSFLNASCC